MKFFLDYRPAWIARVLFFLLPACFQLETVIQTDALHGMIAPADLAFSLAGRCSA